MLLNTITKSNHTQAHHLLLQAVAQVHHQTAQAHHLIAQAPTHLIQAHHQATLAHQALHQAQAMRTNQMRTRNNQDISAMNKSKRKRTSNARMKRQRTRLLNHDPAVASQLIAKRSC
jgi:hypothetical protein